MPDLRIEIARWRPYPDSDAKLGQTSAYLAIHLEDRCLTLNEDIYSQEKNATSNEIYVSLYPLAMWFASSWWRLMYESLPTNSDDLPSHSWRINHEMISAGEGFAWPSIFFAAAGDSIQVWALPTKEVREMPFRYLNGTNGMKLVPKQKFADSVGQLIENVIGKLNESGCRDSALQDLWGFIQDDLNDEVELQKRRLEAVLGFDPEECPARLMKQAIKK